MATATLEELQKDQLAMSIARAVALANLAALKEGMKPADSLVTISESITGKGRGWSVHYGPRDFVNRRGGDLVVNVDELTGAVHIVRGQ
jgi:hypothetical protein